MRRYVLGFLFDPDRERVLLIRKLRPAWQAGRLNGVGGTLEDGETPRESMGREATEEVGLADLPWQAFGLLTGADFEVHLFVAVDARITRAVARTDESIRHVSVRSVVEARLPTLPNLRWLVPMALGAGTDDGPYRIEVSPWS